MARANFGQTTADFVSDTIGGGLMRLRSADLHFYDDSGALVTDLILNGTPVTHIPVDSTGIIPQFQGPDGVYKLWAQADVMSGRQALVAISDATAAAQAAAAGVQREQPNGVAGLDASGLLYPIRLPSLTAKVGAATGWVIATDPAYGATGNGTTDDTAALNAAAAAVPANGCLFIPNGTYKITGTINLPCSVYAPDATFSYTGTGTAVVAGVNTSGTITQRRRYILPRIVKPSQGWPATDTTSTGLVLVNQDTSHFEVPMVQNFATGLLCYGTGAGFAYNKVHLGALWQNRQNLVLDSDGTGWCNQNTFIGGRLQQGISGGATNDDTSANQILIGRTSGSSPNQNVFLNTSIEGDNPAYYRLDCAGRFNRWVSCRWENMGAESRVRWQAAAQDNLIDGGYDADGLVETVVSGALRNQVRDRFGGYISAQNTSGFSVPASASTTVTGWTNTSGRAPYTTGNGAWTPAAGRWHITATLSFTGSASGTKRQIRLLAGGSTTLGWAQAAANATIQTLTITGDYLFDGNTSLVVQAFQDTTAALTLVGTAGYCYLYAERIGG